MPEFDVVIRGGTVVDGLRVPRYRADVAIKDGVIAEIGGRISASNGAEVLDASGLIVGPGFVDLHTHYDAQIQWDPYCSISGWHGVTSVALGNCGFGYAPVRPEERDRSMMMMARNEAIPLASQREGMVWDWVTFPDWLDSLERIPKGVNCLSYMPLNPLMVWVMGLEAAKSRAATKAEQGEMCRLLAESMDAGACGFSLQRLGERSFQADYDGTPMPTDMMADDDVLVLADVLRERDEGLIQITQATQGEGFSESDYDYRFIEELAGRARRPVLYNVVGAVDAMPEFHRGRMKWLEDCHARDLPVIGQGLSLRSRFTFTLADWNLYDSSPVWNKATLGTRAEKMARFADPEHRQRLIDAESEIDTAGSGGPIPGLTVHSSGERPELEKYIGRTLGDIAREEGKHHIEVFLDLSVASDLNVAFMGAPTASADPEKVSELMLSPYVVAGVSDGGAHTKFLAGGSYTTDFIAWLVREHNKLTLEQAHYLMSYFPAHAGGFKKRGYLREGAAADIVIYDFETIRRVPEWELITLHDVPAGEWRRVQYAEGIHWILVNGVVTYIDGESTGSTPGRLLRHGRAA